MRIKVPATSANIGVGFDTLGLALSLSNIFDFNESDTFSVKGFDSPNVEDNLVISVYKSVTKHLNKGVKPISVELVQNEVPISRGLGSSATCILAGVFASNHYNELGLSFDECVNIAADIEGHPDNIFAAAYGGLVATFKDDDDYIYQSFNINKDLIFSVLIPNVVGNTEELRRVLPSKLTYQDTVSNLSRIIHVPHAFASGNLKLLKKVLFDQLHEPYRLPFIPEYQLLSEMNRDESLVVKISGSGPTVLVISNDSINSSTFPELSRVFRFKEVIVDYKGLEIEL